MNVNRLKLCVSALATQLNHWTLFAFFFLFFIKHKDRGTTSSLQTGMWLLFGLLPLGLCLGRRYIEKALPFFALHVGVVLVAGLLPAGNSTYRMLYMGVAFIYSILSILCRYNREYLSRKYLPIPAFFGIAAVAMLILQYQNLHEYQRYYLYLLVFQVFLSSLLLYVERYLRYVEEHKYSIGYMPVKAIFVSGIKLTVTFLLPVCVGLFMVAAVGKMNDVLNFLGKYIRELLRRLVAFLDRWTGEVSEEGPLFMDSAIVETASELGTVEESALSAWESVLMWIGLTVIGSFLCYRLIKTLADIFGNLKLTEEEEEKEKQDIKESSRSISPKKRKAGDIFATLTPAQIIRKRFKRKMERSKKVIAAKGKHDELKLYTAREATGLLEAPDIGALYEKARYSPHECTPQEAGYMKQLCRRKESQKI